MLAAVQFTSELYPESLSAHTLLINTFSIDCCHVLYDSTEHTSGTVPCCFERDVL